MSRLRTLIDFFYAPLGMGRAVMGIVDQTARERNFVLGVQTGIKIGRMLEALECKGIHAPIVETTAITPTGAEVTVTVAVAEEPNGEAPFGE